jgi:hypothetical protein
MKHSHQIWTLAVVFQIAGGDQNSFADDKKPNILILARGARLPVPLLQRMVSQSWHLLTMVLRTT